MKSELNYKIKFLYETIKEFKLQRKLAISSSSGLNVIDIDSIIYLKGEGAYTGIIIKDTNKILCSKPLKEFEDLLNGHCFYRIHKSFIVNLNEISKFIKTDGGYLVVSNGDKIDISYKRKDELLSRLSSNVVFL